MHERDAITRAVSGNASAGDRDRLELHLKSCPECRELHDEMSRMWALMGRIKPRRLSWWPAIAAALVVAVVAKSVWPEEVKAVPGPRTQIKVDKRRIEMSAGSATVTAGGKSFEVKGPGATFEVAVEPDVTRVVVFEGAVDIAAPGVVVTDPRSPGVLFRMAVDFRRKFDETGSVEWLQKAIEFYGKAAAGADPEFAVRGAYFQAQCYELLEPVAEERAMACYRAIADRTGEFAERARELVRRNGVHMHLSRRAWDSIKNKGVGACYGLIQGLDSPDPQVVAFIANHLKLVIDETHLALLVEKLSSRQYRAGAASALREIMTQWTRAKELDDAANRAERDLEFVGQAPGLREITVEELRRQARLLRANLPRELTVPPTLSRVIKDRTIDATARAEALTVLDGVDLGRVVTDALEDPNPRVRAAAADVARTPEKLMELLLADPDMLVRQHCAMSLGRLARVSSIPALIEGLKDPSEFVRAACERALGKMIESPVREWSPNLGVEILVSRFDRLVRMWNVYRIEDLYDLTALERKARFAPDPERELKRARLVSEEFQRIKAQMVGELRESATFEVLFPYLVGREMFIAECLAPMAPRAKIRDIVRGREEQPSEVRAGCAMILAFLADPEAEDRSAAEEALQNGDARVRRALCFALGRIGNARSAARLLPRLRYESESDASVRIEAARAIGRIADDWSFLADFNDPRHVVREEMCYSCKTLDALPFLVRARKDVDERVRFAAAWAMARMGPLIGDLLWEMGTEGAILAIGDIKDTRRVSDLCARLRIEPRQNLRAAIAETLGKIGSKSIHVKDVLLQGLEDPAPEVRQAAFRSLDLLTGGELSKFAGPAFHPALPPERLPELVSRFSAFLAPLFHR